MNPTSASSPAVQTALGTLTSLAQVLAPAGTLRAAINLGNPVLANRDPTTGAPYGVSIDLAQALAQQLGLSLTLVPFDTAGKVVQAISEDSVDIGFYAIDPKRGEDTLFTAPYVVIEGAYMVRSDSPIQRNEEVDQSGNRVVVGLGSAYDLFLTRALQHATIVRAPTSPAVPGLFIEGGYEVAAGVKQQLKNALPSLPDSRLLDGRFMEIRQALAIPKSRALAHAHLIAFIEEMKRSGMVAAALQRHAVKGATVAELEPEINA